MEGKGMKILMTTDTVGGVWVYSLELCKALKAYDVQIHLVAMGSWPSPAQQQEVFEMDNVLLYKSDFKLEWMQDPWEDVEQSRKWINSIYHTIQPDIVHLNNYAQVEEDWTCPVITVFHSCVQTWWQAVKGTSAPETWNQYTTAVKDSLQASDVVVTPTYAILEKAKNTHSFDSPAQVIHNGHDLDFPEEREKEDFIFCIGRLWDEAKNLELLSGVAKKLSWPVYVGGDNINPNTGRECRVDNVTFLGKLSPEEVRDWMQRASIFASPTKYEPFGLAILEAAEAGCALALSNLDTLEELWTDAAAFFDPRDEQDALLTLSRLIADEDQRKDLAGKAKERSSKYTSGKMGAAYHKLYTNVLINKLESV